MGFRFNPEDYQGLPSAPAPTINKGLVGPAIASGVEEAAGQLSSAVKGVGELVGSPTLTNLGMTGAANSQAAAQSFANPTYETGPIDAAKNGHLLGWTAYNILKGLPQFAAPAVGAALAPEVEIPALGSLGAKTLAGAAAAAPQAFGTGEQVTGNPLSALAMTPALAAMQAWMPGHVENLIANATGRGGFAGIAKAGLATGAIQSLIGGAQTGIIDAANPNLSGMDRVHNIVDAAVGGGIMGGVIGTGAAGFGSIRAVRRADPGAVSTDDLNTVINNVLQLPKPDQPGGPQIGSGPPMFADASGRASSSQGEIIATPRDTGMSQTDRMIADRTIPQAQPAIESSTIIQDKQGSLRWSKDYSQDDTTRPFRNLTDPELQSANNALLAKGDNLSDEHSKILTAVQDELSKRSANRSLSETVAQGGAGAVSERTGDGKSGVADQGSSAPAPANDFGTRLDELKKGANTAWGRQVDAKDELDLATKVAERLDTHPSNSLTEFAVRLGLIDGDDPKKVTPLAAAVEQAKAGPKDEASLAATARGSSTTAPGAPANEGGGDRPVDAEFQNQFSKDLSSRRGEALKDFRDNPPANADEARERLFEALGKNVQGEDEARVDGHQAVVDLAKKYGVIDDNERLTPAGTDIARKSFAAEPDAMHQAVAEAQSRGLNGDETSAFDRGARGETTATFGSISELKAYQDGRDWVAPETAGAAETGKHLEGKMADTSGKRVTSAGVPDEQRNMQFLNQAIDQVYGSTLKPQEQAQLKRMVRDGADGKAIDEAARYFATGRGALVQEQPPAREFKGEVVTRGAPRDPEKLAAIRGTDARTAATAARQESTKETSERLIQEHQQTKALLREEIKRGVASGDISRLDQLRLTHMLVTNDLKGVADKLPGRRPSDEPNTEHFLNRVGELAAPNHELVAPERSQSPTALRQRLFLGQGRAALDEIAKNGSSPIARTIANKLNGDWVDRIKITPEQYDPMRSGRASIDKAGNVEVKLFGEQGLTEETFLHEMLHAFTYDQWKGSLSDRAGQGHEVVERVNQLHDQISTAMEKAYPALTRNAIWADQVRKSPDEMIAWVMTNPHAQEVLKTIDINGEPVKSQPSMWDKVKQFFANMLGLPTNNRVMTALDHILDAGHTMLDAKEQVDAAAHVPAPVINDRLTAAVGLFSKEGESEVRGLLDRAGDAKGSIFKAALKTMHGTHLVEEFAERRKVVPEIKDWQDTLNQKNGIANELSKPQLVATDRFTKLQRSDPKNADRVNGAMLAAASGRNPELPWSKQTWLHKDPQAGLLKQMADAEYREFHAMSPEARDAYFGLKNMLEAIGLTHMVQRLQLMVTHDVTLKPLAAKIGDPLIDYVNQTDKHNPEGASGFFRGALNKMMSDMQQHFAQLRGDPTLVREQREQLNQRLTPVEAEMNTIHSQLAATANVPYFHLYREGDHMVAAKLSSTDGHANPEAVRAAAAALEKAGFRDVHISPDLTNPQLFMLVDTKSQRVLAERALQQLVGKGHIEPDSILAGPNTRQAFMSDGSKLAMDHLLAEVKSNPVFATEGKTAAEIATIEAQREAVEKVVKEAWLNSLPTNSLARVMAHRSTVQGFSKDMALSTAHRLSVGISATARMWARPKLNEVFTQMSERARSSLNANDAQHGDVDTIHTLVNEVRQRDIQQLGDGQHDWTDTLRIVSNVFHLAASPVQALIDFTQLPILVVPHLGARHGYANTLTAMAKAAPAALRVVREAFNQGMDVSATRAMDLSITHDVLVKAIPDRATRDFLEHVIASGIVDTGSNVRALTRDSGINPNPKMQTMLTWATVLEQANEMANRLITALAARELHGGKLSVSPEDYAKRTINDTLGQYQSSNAPPILTKKGPLKVAGPLLFQFKNFSINLMWKLYREAHSAFDKSLPDEDRANARNFILGHAVMVTALAGSLGMPFAGAAAGAVDKLKDELMPSEHPFDAIATYRNFLADVFGKRIGEVIAKGVPRSLGFDLSSRVGEEDLLPMTQFLTDRRTWSDTLNEWGAQAVGAPLSMGYQEARGLDQIHNGNIIGGAASMMPSSIRHAMQAYQMTEHGYVDSNGIPLPMASPGAGDILSQLVGVTPADKAEYQDDREVQMNARASLTRASNSLKAQILRSLQTGDHDSARTAISQATRFDAANPAYAVLPRIEAELVSRHKGEAVSGSLNVPLGVSPKDLYARGLTRYSPVDYQAQ